MNWSGLDGGEKSEPQRRGGRGEGAESQGIKTNRQVAKNAPSGWELNRRGSEPPSKTNRKGAKDTKEAQRGEP